MAKIKVENTEISVVSVQNEDYISLTDMAHSQMQEHIIFRWMSLKSTIEYRLRCGSPWIAHQAC